MELKSISPADEHISVCIEETSNPSLLKADILSTPSLASTTGKQAVQQFMITLKDVIALVQDKKKYHNLKSKSDITVTGDFHVMWKALLEGNEDRMNGWIEDIKRTDSDIDATDCNGFNALHYAIIFKQIKLVKLLANSGAGLVCPARTFRLLPLQLAIIGPECFVEAIDLLSSKDTTYKVVRDLGNNEVINEDIHINDIVNYHEENCDGRMGTALDLAISAGNVKAVELLINKGADPNICIGELTSLERAIDYRQEEIVQTLLGLPLKLKQDILMPMKCCNESSRKKHGLTPFNSLISSCPDIAIMVMDHCLHTKHAPHDEDHEIIFDCSLFENKDSNRNKCCRGLPCTCVCDLVQNKCEASLFSGKGFYDSFEKENHPLYLVMESNDQRLLTHPLVKVLMKHKLNWIFWLLYWLNFSNYLIFFISLLIIILNQAHPQSPKCDSSSNSFNSSASNCSVMLTDDQIQNLNISTSIVLWLIFSRLLLELYQLYHQKLVNYILSWVNWIEIVQYVSTFLFVLSDPDCFCATKVVWQEGIVALATSCLSLLIWIESLPWIGIYVIIMKKIVYSFLKVALFGVLLFVAFGLSFYMLFYRPPKENETFSYPFKSILSIIPFTAGDISFGNTFDSPLGIPYEILSYIIWLSAVVVMSILFNNMLVGLAVGDVAHIINEARITEIKLRIDLVLTLEENLPECIHSNVIVKKPIVIRPNISKLKNFFKTVLSWMCIAFSFVFFNLNHIRYWFKFKSNPSKMKKEVEEVKLIMNRLNLKKSGKETCCKPVTQDEVLVMMNKLNKELQYES